MVKSITFNATKNSNLTIRELPRHLAGPVNDIDELLRQTTSFKSFYEPKVLSPFDDLENSTHPNVVLIRGNPLVETTSINHSKTQTLPTNHGMIGTVLTAYNLHQNLQFRPDDLWITILAQFSSYVNGRAEELRDKIVTHQGQKELKVTVAGTIHTVDFGAIHRAFLDKIAVNINDDTLREWFLPGFSTSTRKDDLCASAMAMCSFQAYFAYKEYLICGVPEITLVGSVDDWKLLRAKVERLAEFDGEDKLLSTEWVPRLRIILDHFVESAMNGSTNNLEFWHTIVSHTGYGCAGPDYLTGWITTFSVFDQNGQLYATVDSGRWPVIPLKDIYHNVASCPARIDDNGRDYNATLFVGQMAYDIEIDEKASQNLPLAVRTPVNANATMKILKPRNDWAVAIEDGFVELSTGSSVVKSDATYLSADEWCDSDYWDLWGEVHASPIQKLPGTLVYDTLNQTPLQGASLGLAPGPSQTLVHDTVNGTPVKVGSLNLSLDHNLTAGHGSDQFSQEQWFFPTISLLCGLLVLAFTAVVFLKKNKSTAQSPANPISPHGSNDAKVAV